MLDVFFMSLLPLEDDTFKCHKCIAPHITSSIKLNKIKGKQKGNETNYEKETQRQQNVDEI